MLHNRRISQKDLQMPIWCVPARLRTAGVRVKSAFKGTVAGERFEAYCEQ